jgi:asparagine synthase (glutamine-hydrolysing)
MCGIAGITGNNVKRLEPVLKKMSNCIYHRGPDGEGVAAYENCLLGHRRLSIIDLSTGQQPMYSPYESALIFNGEFYGYQEVKSKLSYPWKTTSDTEVVLALYHQYGKHEFLKHVRGMFSLAIWDEKNQELVAARDRFGEKPFYYALTENNELIFASEIKAILASGLIQPKLSTESLTHYLAHLYVHPHYTIYENIHVLPPAHYLIFKNGQLSIRQYWEMPRQQLKISFEEAKEEFRRLLTKSVRDQLIADVPVGCFLSGGLDSSTITALASMSHNGPLTTISFSFGSNNSELPYSRQVAAKYKTVNIELHQDDFDIAAWFEKMIGIYDEPFADSSNIPTYLISRLAAGKLKVVLTGDGGDELLAGYSNWYRALYQMQHGGGLRKTVKKILHPKYNSSNIAEMHLHQNAYFTGKELQSLCKFSPVYRFNKFTDQPYNTVDAAMRMDLLDYMPGDILVKTDRAAMASSLELRAPFLDVDLAEFCIALPEEYKINDQADKILLRETFRPELPESILQRKKQGFGAPVTEWQRQEKMQQLKKDYLLDKNNEMYNWIDYDLCTRFANQQNYKSWILLTLAIWMKNHGN